MSENINKKGEYVPQMFYSLDGLFEILSALESRDGGQYAKEFPGSLLWATRKESTITVDKKLMNKLETTAEANLMKGGLPKEEYDQIMRRIGDLRSKL